MMTLPKYYRRQCFFYWIFFTLAVLLHLIVPGIAAQQSQQSRKTQQEVVKPSSETQAQITKPEILSLEYVDSRNGFSLRPPCFSEPLSNRISFILPQTEKPDQVWPNLMNWDAIKIPPSKELVRFVPTDSNVQASELRVCLLVVKKNLSIEQMLQTRLGYWQKYPEQATVQKKQTAIFNNHPAAEFTVIWKGGNKNKKHTSRIYREVLIQNEKDRYFMLVLISPDGTAGDYSAGETLMETIARNFHCLGKTEEDRRWTQAGKQAQQLIGKLKPESLKQHTATDKNWYRLTRFDKDIGFFAISRTWQGADKTDKTENLKIQFYGFVGNAEDRSIFAYSQGWQAVSPTGRGTVKLPAGPVFLQGEIVLENNLRNERFDYQFTGPKDDRPGYREQGQWKADTLIVKRYDVPRQGDKSITEKLDVKNDIYLPQSLVSLLPSLLEREIGREYVFMVYYNRALCYYSLRMSATVPLTVGGKQITTTYLIGQAGTQGPIIEFWLDEKGCVVRRRSCGIVMERATEEKIKQLWPNEIKKIKI
jgi:hypothetical protein